MEADNSLVWTQTNSCTDTSLEGHLGYEKCLQGSVNCKTRLWGGHTSKTIWSKL